MKRIKLLITTLIICLSLIHCKKEEDPLFTFSDKVVVSQAEFNSARRDNLTIQSLEIIGDSLKIIFNAGGCNGDSWEIKLIDSEDVLQSLPPQRNLILSLKDDELCEALITKEVSFSIADLKVEGNEVKLNIVNANAEILFQY